MGVEAGMRSIAIAAGILLALTGCSASATQADERAEVDSAIIAFYDPYRLDAVDSTADWDRPIWSARLRALIGKWKQGFSDEEVADLQDFGWLCECQDWDSRTFKVTISPHAEPAGDRAEIDVQVAIGWNEVRTQHLHVVRVGDAWLIDDIRSEAFDQGLHAALEQAIAPNAEGAA